MKYALVLEGGGAKGAYQIGAYFALSEMGFEFSKIVGTSIGAFNGAMICQGDAYECYNAWKNLNLEDFKNELDNVSRNDDIFSRLKAKLEKHDIKIPELTISPDPLYRLVDRFIDEDKIRNSPIDFGICTVNISDFKVERLFKDDIEEGLLKDYIIATCYLPFFKLKRLHGKYFLDGGFASPMPMEMIEEGTDIILIRLSNVPLANTSRAKYVIEPRKSLGRTMDFNKEKADELIKLGYFDAFRAVKGLAGDGYYISRVDEEESIEYLIDILQAEAESSDIPFIRNIFEKMIPKLAEEFELPLDFKYDEILYKVLERQAKKKNIDKFKIYTAEELTREVLSEF